MAYAGVPRSMRGQFWAAQNFSIRGASVISVVDPRSIRGAHVSYAWIWRESFATRPRYIRKVLIFQECSRMVHGHLAHETRTKHGCNTDELRIYRIYHGYITVESRIWRMNHGWTTDEPRMNHEWFTHRSLFHSSYIYRHIFTPLPVFKKLPSNKNCHGPFYCYFDN